MVFKTVCLLCSQERLLKMLSFACHSLSPFFEPRFPNAKPKMQNDSTKDEKRKKENKREETCITPSQTDGYDALNVEKVWSLYGWKSP